MRRFEPKKSVRDIRDAIDHPIVDADGHQIEFMPLVIEEVGKILSGAASPTLKTSLG